MLTKLTSRVQVRVLSGLLEGLVCENEVDSGKKYYSFQGIPYAKKPIGELRFKAPQQLEPWTGIKDATKDGDQCFSRNSSRNIKQGSEDCLYLNVYTPKLPDINGDQGGYDLKPVMVFIHGGAFISGSNSKNSHNPEFLLREDVIIVAINYRYGLLGFLSLEDPTLEVPGNAGFKDMVMALKWIKNNIKNFNGDPNNVTIFGESAGAVSVQLLILSPLAKGLFHKAIAQSGCALNLWAHSKKMGPLLAEALGVEDKSDDKKILQKLSDMTVEEVHDLQEKLPKHDWDVSEMPANGLTIENPNQKGEAFLSQDPFKLLEEGTYNHIPLLIGFNSREGMLIHFQRKTAPHDLLPNIEQHVPYVLGLEKGSVTSKHVAHSIVKFYYSDQDPRKVDIDNFYKLTSDNFFIREIHKAAMLQSGSSSEPLFFYEMTLETSNNLFKKTSKIKSPGVCHGDDLFYLFKPRSHGEIEPNSTEDIGIRRFCRLWTNFAKYGDPNSREQDYLLPVLWKPFTTSDQYYLEIGENLSLKKKPASERMTFWEDIFRLKQTSHKL